MRPLPDAPTRRPDWGEEAWAPSSGTTPALSPSSTACARRTRSKINFLGHTLSLSVLIPFLLPLAIIMTGLALWPFFEQWATGDRGFHHVNDRPRNAPVRTAIGVAGICFYGILWAEGANDVIAEHLQVPLYTITWPGWRSSSCRSAHTL